MPRTCPEPPHSSLAAADMAGAASASAAGAVPTKAPAERLCSAMRAARWAGSGAAPPPLPAPANAKSPRSTRSAVASSCISAAARGGRAPPRWEGRHGGQGARGSSVAFQAAARVDQPAGRGARSQLVRWQGLGPFPATPCAATPCPGQAYASNPPLTPATLPPPHTHTPARKPSQRNTGMGGHQPWRACWSRKASTPTLNHSQPGRPLMPSARPAGGRGCASRGGGVGAAPAAARHASSAGRPAAPLPRLPLPAAAAGPRGRRRQPR